jgi:hypothetical protein
MEPQVIRESRVKVGGYLALSVGFVAVGLWMALQPVHPRDAFWGWVAVVFFGLTLPTFAWQLVSPMRLTLDATGFVLSGGLRRAPKRFGWHDIDRFFVARGPRGVKMIRFNYLQGRAPPGRMTKVARTLGGADAGLPPGWTLSPEKVVDILNDYRSRYGTAGATPGAEQPQIVS